MIKIDKTDVFGFEGAIRGMRNPMNSWHKADSGLCRYGLENPFCFTECPSFHSEDVCMTKYFTVGENDKKLACNLVKAGSDHRKFLRMIHVQADVLAPLYWWKEYDTYKVGTVANSCSTMHKIHSKEFTLDDFSHEHLSDGEYGNMELLKCVVTCLNVARIKYIESNDKEYWWQMIQLLPSSYNQLRTIDLNYEVLLNIYYSRKNHKLDEWHSFCDWIESLPYMRDFLCLDNI